MTGYATVTQDVTERKRAELAQARLAAIATNSPEAIISVEPESRCVLFWNKGAERNFELTAAEMIGQPLSRLVPPENAHELEDAFERMRRGEHIEPYETIRRRRDGALIDVAVRPFPVRDAEGRLLHFTAILQDISAAKRAKEALRESEERNRALELEHRVKARTEELESTLRALRDTESKLRSIIDNSTAVIYVKDLQGRYHRRYEVLHHVRQVDVLGKTDHDVHPGEQADALRANDRKVVAAHAPMEFEEAVSQADGPHTFVSLKFPLYDHAGKLYAVCGISTDITERKRATEELVLRTIELKKAQELNRLKDHFLSTISLEVKTPLALIQGYTELLEDMGPSEELVSGIRDGTKRLTEHIDQILDYSAMISGTLPLYPSTVNLAEVARHVADLVHERLGQRDLALRIEVDPRTPEIRGDYRRIVQMVLELVNNAEKFTPAGGKLGIRIGPSGGRARIDVWDTGPGLPEAEFGRIWEAFSQLDIGDAVRKGGLGLGLTIVKKLAELHGGRVGVVSLPGKGSTFSLYLPVAVKGEQITSRP